MMLKTRRTMLFFMGMLLVLPNADVLPPGHGRAVGVDVVEFMPVGRDVFHEKAVNSKLKFTSTIFLWGGGCLEWESWICPPAGREDPRSPGGTGGAKSPEGI
jgi:hypothetical protein